MGGRERGMPSTVAIALSAYKTAIGKTATPIIAAVVYSVIPLIESDDVTQIKMSIYMIGLKVSMKWCS